MKQREQETLTELCRLFAKLGIMMIDQAERFFEPEDRSVVRWLLEQGNIEWGVFGCMPCLIPVISEHKPRAGRGEKRRVEVYYLLANGREIAKKSGMRRARIRMGCPLTKIAHQRVHHELLVVETLLWMGQSHNVVDFCTENELKSMQDAPADLRVVEEKKGTYSFYDCEVVVTNTRQQIEEKADGMLFFTPSKRQAHVIQAVKRAPAIVLNLKQNAPKAHAKTESLTPIESEVMAALRRNGGALTGPATAKTLGKDRAFTSKICKQMERKGALFGCSVHAKPGVQKGRPRKIYALSADCLDSFSDLLFAYELSDVLVKAFNQGWFPMEVDRNNSIARISDGHQVRTVQFSQNASA